jgi:ubiquinone/menaquinone biosynthesis C-methylase UbiE
MSRPDNFIDIPFNVENLDLYIVRTSILKAIKWAMPNLSGELLDIGSGKMPYKEFILNNSEVNKYIGLDIENALEYDPKVKPDYTWDGVKMPFKDSQYNCAIGTEVLEHCPEPEVVLKETHRVLKSGGVFFFTVPFLWNLHEVPHDEYRYTPFSLERHLKNSGFTNIEIYATGGWHLSMAQMMGLWLNRSSIRNLKGIKKKLISKVIMEAMKRLIKLGKIEKIDFMKGSMITGLYGVAKKA